MVPAEIFLDILKFVPDASGMNSKMSPSQSSLLRSHRLLTPSSIHHQAGCLRLRGQHGRSYLLLVNLGRAYEQIGKPTSERGQRLDWQACLVDVPLPSRYRINQRALCRCERASFFTIRYLRRPSFSNNGSTPCQANNVVLASHRQSHI